VVITGVVLFLPSPTSDAIDTTDKIQKLTKIEINKFDTSWYLV